MTEARAEMAQRANGRRRRRASGGRGCSSIAAAAAARDRGPAHAAGQGGERLGGRPRRDRRRGRPAHAGGPAGASRKPGTAVVIDNGVAPDGTRYEWVAYRCSDRRREDIGRAEFEGIGISLDWPGVKGHEGGGVLRGAARAGRGARVFSQHGVHILPSQMKGVAEPDLVISGADRAGRPQGQRHLHGRRGQGSASCQWTSPAWRGSCARWRAGRSRSGHSWRSCLATSPSGGPLPLDTWPAPIVTRR